MGKNGTVITMKDHMLQRTPDEEEWKVAICSAFYLIKVKTQEQQL